MPTLKWGCLRDLSLEDQIDHLKMVIEDLTMEKSPSRYSRRYREAVEPFSHQQRAIVEFLYKNRNTYKPIEAIRAAASVWGNSYDLVSRASIRQQIFKIRIRLRELKSNFVIVNGRARGYMMMVPEEVTEDNLEDKIPLDICDEV